MIFIELIIILVLVALVVFFVRGGKPPHDGGQ